MDGTSPGGGSPTASPRPECAARTSAGLSPFAPEHTLVVWNRTAGRGPRRRAGIELARGLARRGYTVRDAPADGDRPGAVIAIGGDGTLLRIVGAVPPEVPLALFPAGTVNLLARTLGLPRTPSEFLELLERPTLAPVRLGRADGRPFASVASVGFDAEVVAAVPERLKRALGPAAFVLQALREVARRGVPALEVRSDGELVEGAWCGLIAGRGPFFAGPFEALPGVHPSDGELTALLLGGRRRVDLLRHAVDLASGRLASSPRVRRVAAQRSIEVRAAARTAVELDGDPAGRTPVRFDLEPHVRYILTAVPSSGGRR